ncbi:MAG: Histone-like Protein p6 [Bacteriophage sp.]|nr:MAG: Histone-like Protein p6 [Bacteriophage sp.]
MITRTIITAKVKAEVVEKTDQGIQSREVEVNVEKCTSKEKAEIALGKMFKNAIVNVLECVFYADKCVMSDSDFAEHSTVKEHLILTEEDVAKINVSRKRGK